MNDHRCLITLEPLSNKTPQPQPGYSLQGIKQLVGFASNQLQLPFTRKQFVTEQPRLQQGLSISGYQPKLSLRLVDGVFTVVDAFGTYILKPSPEAYPYLAENEHAIMTVMKRLGFAIPAFGLVRFKTDNTDKTAEVDELAFIIKRFDRDSDKQQKVHQEQLDGAMGVNDKYGNINDEQTVSYESACGFLINTIDSSLPFKKDLFLRVIYAYLLGNNDFHLRNLAVLIPQTAKNQLAPIYDFVSTAPYQSTFTSCYLALPLLKIEEKSHELAPGYNTAYGQPIGYDFIQLGQGLALNDKMVKKLIKGVVAKADVVTSTLRHSFMPLDHCQQVVRCFEHRLKLIQVLAYEPL
ncbi:MAG: serine/threonine-protein kinase HipA [Phenylobacterium sp.]|jgi:serine/threonine-protein kinase HipA